MPHKLTELDRVYCQTLLSEIYNVHFVFEWGYGILNGWDRPHRNSPDPNSPGGTGREAWRHYGGTNPNSNGSNWLFADGHVQWHSVTSLEKLFCCQDFAVDQPRDWNFSDRELQKEKCGGPPSVEAPTRRR